MSVQSQVVNKDSRGLRGSFQKKSGVLIKTYNNRALFSGPPGHGPPI